MLGTFLFLFLKKPEKDPKPFPKRTKKEKQEKETKKMKNNKKEKKTNNNLVTHTTLTRERISVLARG